MSQGHAPLHAAIMVALLGLVAGVAPAGAQSAADCNGAAETDSKDGRCARQASDLPEITVTATLNPRPVGQVAADVSVISREDMDRHLVSSLRDLIRYEPGVSVVSTPGRFGASGFRIRGLGGNRVRIQIDGVPVSDSYAVGSLMSVGRNTVDLDSIKRVEIVRGPASSLYGSDALGGVVSYVTKDPADYLEPGQDHFVGVKGQYDSVDAGRSLGATFAVGNDRHGFMVLANRREGSELDNRGTVATADATRTRPDPLDKDSDNVLLKYVHHASSGRVDRITLDAQISDTRTRVLSAVDERTLQLDASDRARRQRVSFRQQWQDLDSALVDRIDWGGWVQRTDFRQRSIEMRNQGPGYQRHVTANFEQRVVGLQLHAFKQGRTGSVLHDITWGLEWLGTRTVDLRDGYAVNLADGSVSQDESGGNADNYPARDFPPSDTVNGALFVQDEMHLLDDKLQIIAGVRLDHYKFDPRADALFDSLPLADHVTGQSDEHASPKLGVVWQFAPHFNVYGQYASGFRAPPYSDLGLLFSNMHFGYAAIPNPDLKPETSRSYELGLRGSGEAGRFTLAVYSNRYRDFIDSVHMLSRDEWPDWALQTPGLNLVFQSINRTRARIRGVEASAELYLGAINEGLDGWRIHASASAARGDVGAAGESWTPLDSVDPGRAIVGLGYQGYDWGVDFYATGVARKDRLTNPDAFRAPGHAIFDLYAHWSPTPSLQLHAGITNISDRRYWNWSALRGGAITAAQGSTVEASAIIDRYSAPGRAFSVSARWSF